MKVLDNAGNVNSQQINDLVFNSYTGDLVITEINYNDPGQWDNLDFFEVYNNGTSTFPLGGLTFDVGVNFTFPEYNLEPSSYVVIAKPAYSGGDCGSLEFGCGSKHILDLHQILLQNHPFLQES